MAQTDYTLEFVNGVATDIQLPVGTYTYISHTIKGYEGGTVESFTVTPQTTSISLTISATGVLNITVEDDLGQPITAGELRLSSQDGTQQYGEPVTIANGAAQFSNIPFDADGIDIFVSQTLSDESHDPAEGTKQVSMIANPTADTLINERKKINLNINLADENYDGITGLNGSLVVNG